MKERVVKPKGTYMKMTYVVRKASQPIELGGGWNSGHWEGVNVLELDNHMGERPEHFPKTQAKLLYDDNNLHVFFRVEDRYVRAVSEKTHDDVCHDSCVEFFFTPEDTTTPESDYFNLEVNCGGTILFHYGKSLGASGCTRGEIDPSDCERVEVHGSLPRIIDPEIIDPVVWTLNYKLPFSVVGKYSGTQVPRPGTKWSGNLYKCADGTSHPHWLAWSPVDNPTPNFHLPKFFGVLEFE